MEIDAAYKLLRKTMNSHGLTAWTAVINPRPMRRLGCCRYRKLTIELSQLFVRTHDEEHVMNTILHEIAHALAGARAGHGERWKRTARSIGLKNPQRLKHDTSDEYKAACDAKYEERAKRRASQLVKTTDENIAALNACIDEVSNVSGGEYEIWLKPGFIFEANGCHMHVVYGLKEAKEVCATIAKCEDANCDMCCPEEEAS